MLHRSHLIKQNHTKATISLWLPIPPWMCRVMVWVNIIWLSESVAGNLFMYMELLIKKKKKASIHYNVSYELNGSATIALEANRWPTCGPFSLRSRSQVCAQACMSVWVYSCKYALPHMSFLCWERAMGNGLLLHRMVGLFKGRQHNKRGRLGRESEIVREWVWVMCLPASGAFSVLLPWQQRLAVFVCVLCYCVCVCVWQGM